MQPQPLDPLNLTEEASLNSLELRELPGADPSCVGRRAFEVLSLHALQRLATDADGSPTGPPPDEAAVVGWLAAADAAPPRAKQAAVDAFGRRLGHLVATLTVEPGAGPLAHGWRRGFLDHWRTLERVWLAGGIVASYVRGGQPISPRGIYGRLPVQRLNADLQARLGEPCEIRIGHDGTLAAAGLAQPRPPAAVIVVGTYLGSGFAPRPDTLLPLAPDFRTHVPAGN